MSGILTWHCDASFDETSFEPNKAGDAYKKLIHEEWNTQKTFELKSVSKESLQIDYLF